MTALGDLGGRAPVLRSGARPGDVVALAGRLGWSACGLAVLRRGFSSPIAAVAAHRRPDPAVRRRPGRRRGRGDRRCATSATGCSPTSGTWPPTAGSSIDLDRAALARACLEPPGPLQQVGAALGVDPMAWVLTGGEDHALVATFPPRADLPEGWTAIGSVRTGPRRAGRVRGRARRRRDVVQAVGRGGSRACPLRLSARAPGRTVRACGRCPTTIRWRTYLVEQVQQEYVQRYGGRDAAVVDPAEFLPPRGIFLVAEVDGVPAGCGAWRALVAGRRGDQAGVRGARVPPPRARRR